MRIPSRENLVTAEIKIVPRDYVYDDLLTDASFFDVARYSRGFPRDDIKPGEVGYRDGVRYLMEQPDATS